MKTRTNFLVLFLVLVLILAACGDSGETADPAEGPPAVEEPTAEPENMEETAPETEVVEPTEEEAAAQEAAAIEPPPMDTPDLMPAEQFQMYVDDLPVEGWGKTIAAGAALDPAVGPSNNGFPPFVFIDFSSPGDELIPDPKVIFTMDVPQGRIFPVAEYLAMYDEGGRDYAQDAVSSLQQILDDRPATLDEKLLTLPGFGDAQQGVRGEPTYIDFPGGSGVGFVAGYGQEIGPLLNNTLVYQFVGLTETHSDTPFGTQYISFVFPLEANFLSDLESVTDEEVAEAEADLDAYLAGVTEKIDNAEDTDFTPNLSAINTAMQSITIGAEEAVDPPPEEAVAVQPPPMDDPSLMPVEQFQMYVDDLPVEGWGKTIAAGAALDPEVGPSNNGFPPFVFIDFSSPGDELIPDPKVIFTMDVPQGRIFPVAEYLAMYDEGGREYAQDAVSSLQQILDDRPATLDEKLLTLPGFGDAQQGVRGEPTYIDFPGGSGVGFVAGYGQEVGPLLNDTLVYQFVGLTETHSDTPFGTQYISFVFPLEANFLSDLESVTDDEVAEAEADLDAYLAGKTEEINNAADTDFTPNLSAINTAMQSITISPEEAAEPAEEPDGVEPPPEEMTAEEEEPVTEEIVDEEGFPIVGVSDKATGTVSSIECPGKIEGDEVEGETYSCGTYTVPLNYEDPQGVAIDITYLAVKSRSDNPAADPFLYLLGGPGQSGVGIGFNDASLFEQIREQRDLIYVATRGTLYGQRLGLEECFALAMLQGASDQELQTIVDSIVPPASDDANEPAPETEQPFEEALEAAQKKAGKLNSFCEGVFDKAGLDVTQFTTANTARDVVGLKDALGYELYNLAGISYGTRLALVTMRDHPDSGLRSVLLDSPDPPNNARLIRDVRATHDSARQLFADCAADDACSTAYPNLEERVQTLLNNLDAAPLQVGDNTITSLDVATVILDLSDKRADFMPLMIAELEQGVLDTYLGLRDRSLGLAQDQPEGELDPELQELQAFFRDIMNAYSDLVAQGAATGDPLTFLGEIMESLSKDDPRGALTQLIQDNMEGDKQQDLLRKLNDLDDDQLAVANTVGEDQQAGTRQDSANFLQSVINCQEDLPFESVDEALAEYDRLEIPQFAVSNQEMIREISNCTGWRLVVAENIENDAVTSQVPTLILQGEFDRRTPVSWGQLTAEGLENSTLAMIPYEAHETWYKAESCVGVIATAFVNDPTQTPDLSCLEEGKVQFVLPDSE